MQAISLKLDSRALRESDEAAVALGVNRSEFIRQAIHNEARRLKQLRIAQQMADMSSDPRFVAEFGEWELATVADGIVDEATEGWFSLPEDGGV